jgi:uncharacterized protein (UPF0335 family)
MARRKKIKGPKAPPLGSNGLSADDQRRLREGVEKIEALLGDRKEIDDDLALAKKDLRKYGFDGRTVADMIRLRALDAEKRQLRENLRDVYSHALGMLADLPLGKAAIAREGKS